MALKCIVGRIGGKSKSKKIIVDDYFPEGYETMLYVEPFVGGGSIFFYKNPSVKEVVNDLDINIYNIFRGAKIYSQEEVAKVLSKTYTKEDFNAIRDSKPTDDFSIFCKSYYILNKSIMCVGRTYRNDRTKMNINLKGYRERLEDVDIYNVDYKELITEYDSDETFFYLDPPYENSKGLYKNDVVAIEDMYDMLKNIKGKFLLSYNNSDKARELFKEYNIHGIVTKYSATTFAHNRNKNTNVVELLICNY
jgi:DNA adenine methylase